MTLPAAALLICSSGLPHVALAVERAAEREHVPVAVALAVSCLESGIRPLNPLGIHGYRGDTHRGIRLGVQSLRNRLRANPLPRALAIYHRGRDCEAGRKYAGRVIRLARAIERLAAQRK